MKFLVILPLEVIKMKKIIGLLIVSFICFITWIGLSSAKNSSQSEVVVFTSNKKSEKQEKTKVYSSNYLLMDLSDNQVLLEKNRHQKVPIASLTKIMTAYILLEEEQDLTKKILVDGAIIDQLTSEGASMAGFMREDEVSIRDIAYAILLPSGGEAAELAAKHVAGSEKNFVHLMNEYAHKMGLQETNFKNTTGLDVKGHYSSVSDISQLLKQALKNEHFYQIFTTLEYTTEPTLYEPNGYFLKSTLLRDGNQLALNNGKIVGGKTGYTQKAGLCLASVAEKNGTTYLLVTVGAKGDSFSEQYNVMDAVNIYNLL